MLGGIIVKPLCSKVFAFLNGYNGYVFLRGWHLGTRGATTTGPSLPWISIMSYYGAGGLPAPQEPMLLQGRMHSVTHCYCVSNWSILTMAM